MGHQPAFLALLPKLGNAIDASLASWETYLAEIATQPTYEAIVSASTETTNDETTKPTETPTATKIQALQYLLLNLPARYTTLLKSLNDPSLAVPELPEQCDNLLDELDQLGGEIELQGCFASILGRRFVEKVVGIEKGIVAEEQCRRQELGRLKAVQIALVAVGMDGELEVEDVRGLVGAMEGVGVGLRGEGLIVEGQQGGGGDDDDDDDGDEA